MFLEKNKLNKLRKVRYDINCIPETSKIINIEDNTYSFGIVYACDNSNKFYWTAHILAHHDIYSQEETHWHRMNGYKQIQHFSSTTKIGSNEILFSVPATSDTKILWIELYYI